MNKYIEEFLCACFLIILEIILVKRNQKKSAKMPRVHFAKSVPPMTAHKSNISELGMLQLEPKEYVNICQPSGEAKLKLTNVSNEPLIYKIQTTSPEKFRVRPRCGVVQPNETAEVNIWLKPDHQLSNDTKDKFLVMAINSPHGDCSIQEVTDLWRQKDANDPDVENHRLVCRMDDQKECVVKGGSQVSNREFGSQEWYDKFEANQKFSRHLQYGQLALILLLFIGFGYLLFEKLHGVDSGGSGSRAAAFACPKHK